MRCRCENSRLTQLERSHTGAYRILTSHALYGGTPQRDIHLKRVAHRIEQVQDPVVPIVGRLIQQNPGTISLGQGIVHYSPPPEAIAALQKNAEVHKYGNVCGTEELLNQIRGKVSSENRIPLHESAAIYTAGSNMAFLNAILAIADINDEIVLMSPYYFNHEMAINIAGCKVVAVSTDANYQLDLSKIESAITNRTRAIVTVSPNNPTGAIYPESDLRSVNKLCDKHDLFHISDEAYEYFTYGEARHFSPGSIPGASSRTISLFTLSKAFGMAGWRSGYMIVPEDLQLAVEKIQDTNLVCPPMVGQPVAASAIQHGKEWCQPRVKELESVRRTILRELEGVRCCEVPTPDGAFYMLLKLDCEWRDMDLVSELINQYQVATLPGSTFGVTEGCSIRISYGALEPESVLEGIGRLKCGLNALL